MFDFTFSIKPICVGSDENLMSVGAHFCTNAISCGAWCTDRKANETQRRGNHGLVLCVCVQVCICVCVCDGLPHGLSQGSHPVTLSNSKPEHVKWQKNNKNFGDISKIQKELSSFIMSVILEARGQRSFHVIHQQWARFRKHLLKVSNVTHLSGKAIKV